MLWSPKLRVLRFRVGEDAVFVDLMILGLEFLRAGGARGAAGYQRPGWCARIRLVGCWACRRTLFSSVFADVSNPVCQSHSVASWVSSPGLFIVSQEVEQRV